MKNIFVGDDTCFNGLRDFVSIIFFSVFVLHSTLT